MNVFAGIMIAGLLFTATGEEYEIEEEVYTVGVVEDEEYTVAELKDKVAGYSRMKRGGTALLVGGISLDVIGIFSIARMVTIINDNYYIGDGSEIIAYYFAGVYSLGFGIPLTIAGSVVSSIGSRKYREYIGRLERSSVGFGYDFNRRSLTLSYDLRF